MENADMQLVRTHEDGGFNLAVGEPFFLEDHLPFAQAVAPEGPFMYPQSRGEPELLRELERRHQGMHVVVTIGAKQGISASLYAFRDVYGAVAAKHPSPYWPSFPYLVRGERMYFDAPAPDQNWTVLMAVTGETIKIDVEDEWWLSRFPWIITNSGYAIVGRALLHRVLLDAPRGLEVDHINGDKLDNRKGNLRLATKSQNSANQRGRSHSSGYKGVSWDAKNKKWQVQLCGKDTQFFVGRFENEEDAARAYDVAAFQRLGKFARLNFQSTSLEINTLVNNPNGACCSDASDILDCVYGSPVYGWEDGAPLPPHKVAIYSASKMLGLSGLRVGWAVTADARLAAAMATFVERYTSGVCVTSQRHVAHVLAHLRRHDDQPYFDAARQDLLANGEVFNKLLTPAMEVVEGVPATGKGMFAWFKVGVDDQESFKAAMEAAKVRLVSGEACGATTAGWWRMSMGQRPNVTQQALEALSRAWKRSTT